jgi:hypothetical protein
MQPHEMIPTAPAQVTPPIERLIKRLGGVTPLFVPVVPEPNATVDECFSTVDHKIQAVGGTAVYGWAIWVTPVMVEAEFHAVWQSPTGSLTDLTPKVNGATEIMFVPDRAARYEGRQVNNVRMPVYENDVLVEQFIRVNDQIFDVMNRGDRAFQHGEVAIPAEEIGPLLEKQLDLNLRIMLREFGPNKPCVCGSTRKLKHCCGRTAAA